MIRKILYIFLIVYFGSLVFISLLCPILEYERSPSASICYSFLKNSCHQIPSRCLWILGSNMGLCSRCFSIYLSFLVISNFLFVTKKLNFMGLKKTALISLLLAFPLVIDGGTQLITDHLSNNWLRSITGMLAGSGFALLSTNFSKGGKWK